jgi:uncharacterized lipoprotein YmbA
VGAFVLVALGLAFVGLWALGARRLFTSYRTYVVFFPNAVGGLKPGAPVTLRQVPVGQVRDVDLVFIGTKIEDSRIRVVIDIPRGRIKNLAGDASTSNLTDAQLARILIDGGLRAAVRTSSPIAGQKSVDLDFYPQLAPRRAGFDSQYPEIPTAPTGFELLNERLEDTLEKLSNVPLDEVVVQIQATFHSAQQLLDQGDVQGALRSLRATLDTANRTLARGDQTLGGVEAMTTDMRSTLAGIDRTMKSVQASLAQLDRTLATVDRNVERSAEVEHAAALALDETNELPEVAAGAGRHAAAASGGAGARQAAPGGPEVNGVHRMAIVAVAAVAAGGCVLGQSKHAQTFVLDAIVPPPGPSPAPDAVLGVLRVAVPGWIDRPQITGRGASGQVVADEYARWGEPLARGIQRVMAENLAALLPGRRLVTAPFVPGVTVAERLELTIVEAARQADGSVLVTARWVVLAPGGTPLAQGRSSHAAHPAAPGASGVVAGTNEALAALSRDIADALRALPPPSPSP